jgi:hypothetical protein
MHLNTLSSIVQVYIGGVEVKDNDALVLGLSVLNHRGNYSTIPS